jgi:hypothetical protein
MGVPPKEEATAPASPHEEPSHAPSIDDSLPQDDPPEPPEEVTPASTAKVQKQLYFVSTVLRDAWESYTMQQKLLYTLLITSRKLCHYFQGHPIRAVNDRPLETILRYPNVIGRVAEWSVELQPFEIPFVMVSSTDLP